MTYIAQVVVTLKPVINDPQGLVIAESLHRLGFTAVGRVRVGKHIDIELDAPDQAAAEAQLVAMCEQLLRNPVIEDYTVQLREAVG